MTLVWLGIALWVVVIINHVCRRIAAALDRPLTDYDRRCSAIDEQLDELAARRATRPHGNCDVLPFPARERTRGDAS